MPRRAGPRSKLSFSELSSATWKDLERLFGERGACGGCWCMTWRLRPSVFAAQKGEGNRLALRALVKARRPLGVLAYIGDDPVGWCAVAPRADFPYLERSRVLAPVDDRPVWSVTCFFIRKEYRRQGVSKRLLRAATQLAWKHGAAIVEGYPVAAAKKGLPDVFVWTGVPGTFQSNGFVEVARRSPTRPIMRAFRKK